LGLRAFGPQAVKPSGRDKRVEDMTATAVGLQKVEHGPGWLRSTPLASAKQMHEFVSRLHPNDRILLVGDTRQHESVGAGRIFAQIQDAGMKTVKLDEIVRQRDPVPTGAVRSCRMNQHYRCLLF
jgi:AAA domain